MHELDEMKRILELVNKKAEKLREYVEAGKIHDTEFKVEADNIIFYLNRFFPNEDKMREDKNDERVWDNLERETRNDHLFRDRN